MNRLGHLYLFWAVFLTFSIFSTSGCSDNLPNRVPVSGRVLMDGKPLEYGTVLVYPKGQRMACGTLGPGGKFTLTTFDDDDGCMLGKHPVAVNAAKGISTNETQWFAPKKYADTATSGLEIDITGPKDDIIINLNAEPKRKFPYIEKL
jgi:hypothetical protein